MTRTDDWWVASDGTLIDGRNGSVTGWRVMELVAELAAAREALDGLVAWIDGDWKSDPGGRHRQVLFTDTTVELVRARRALNQKEEQ